MTGKAFGSPSFEVAQGDEQLIRRESPVIQRDQASPGAALTDELIPELEVRPLLELDRLEQAQGFTVGRALDEGEVDAIVLKLEGANFVLMEDEEKNDAYIVDLDEDDPIHRVPAREVAEGVFILLRTEGGGNYVVDMANHLLGNRAFPARAKQERWKQELREAVAARGADAVVAELKRRGAPRANTSNLRNWQSPRSIRTQDHADFDAILSLGGLDDQRDDFWQTMDLIDRAHSRAGQEIRRRLLAEVRQADRGELIKHGRLEFELEEGGGSLTAFRVEDVRRERRRTVQDGSRSKTYRVQFPETGWDPARDPWPHCLRGAILEGFSLVVFEGGSVAELVACAESRGIVAFYALHEGAYAPYIFGAPGFVNAGFLELFPDGLPPITPLVVASNGSPSADPFGDDLEGDGRQPWPECLRGDIAAGFSLVVCEGGSVDELEACVRSMDVTAVGMTTPFGPLPSSSGLSSL